MAKRAKASRTYRDSLDDDVEILGSTQGSGVPGILQSTALSRPSKRAATASSARRYRYSYREDSGAEDGNEEFVASPPAENDDEGMSDAAAPLSGKRGRGSGSGSNSNKVGSKRSRAIAKSRRSKSSSDSENG